MIDHNIRVRRFWCRSVHGRLQAKRKRVYFLSVIHYVPKSPLYFWNNRFQSFLAHGLLGKLDNLIFSKPLIFPKENSIVRQPIKWVFSLQQVFADYVPMNPLYQKSEWHNWAFWENGPFQWQPSPKYEKFKKYDISVSRWPILTIFAHYLNNKYITLVYKIWFRLWTCDVSEQIMQWPEYSDNCIKQAYSALLPSSNEE